jgi:hypothetical protein
MYIACRKEETMELTEQEVAMVKTVLSVVADGIEDHLDKDELKTFEDLWDKVFEE